MLSTCLIYIYIYIIYIYNTYIYYLSGGVEHVFQSVTTSPPFQTAEVFAVVQAACGEEKIVSVKVNGWVDSETAVALPDPIRKAGSPGGTFLVNSEKAQHLWAAEARYDIMSRVIDRYL